MDDARPTSARSIPDATVARLPGYLAALDAMLERGSTTCSSESLAEAAGVTSAKVRKDLSHLGSYGTRGVGYDVDYLRQQVARVMGGHDDRPLLVVGAGHLGQALSSYSGFAARGFRVAAVVDVDPSLVGRRLAGLPVQPLDRLSDLVAEHGVTIAVLAVPADAAQEVAERLVAAGVRSILNFAPVPLHLPEAEEEDGAAAPVQVRAVDLSTELQILAYHQQRAQERIARPGPPVAATAQLDTPRVDPALREVSPA